LNRLQATLVTPMVARAASWPSGAHDVRTDPLEYQTRRADVVDVHDHQAEWHLQGVSSCRTGKHDE
jgi:hypothetical protein